MKMPVLFMLAGGLITYLLIDEKGSKKMKKMFCDMKNKIME
ncbi:MAG: hypothetical protein ACI35W_00015 [Anaeroplasmataceae bacterium]